MGRLFGTDGVRGIANKELTPELAFNLGKAGTFVLKKNAARPVIVIGKDTRVSGDMLENALTAGILAVGGNEETARLAGINVDKMKILTYVFVSMMACFAGVIYGARFATVQPAIGTGSEMNIIAAVIVGGTSMMGGVGTIVGTVIGSVLMAMITNVLIMLGVSAYWQAFVFGFILIVSLFIDRYRQRSLNA